MSRTEASGRIESDLTVEESRFPLYSVVLSIILLIFLAGTLTVVSECRSESCTVLGQVAAATVAV